MLKDPIDRPFRSREELEREQALEAQYRALGNSELLAALQPEAEAERSD